MEANQALSDMREAAQGIDGHVKIVRVFFNPEHKYGLQVFKKSRKVGPLLLPTPEQTIEQLLDALYDVEAK